MPWLLQCAADALVMTLHGGRILSVPVWFPRWIRATSGPLAAFEWLWAWARASTGPGSTKTSPSPAACSKPPPQRPTTPHSHGLHLPRTSSSAMAAASLPCPSSTASTREIQDERIHRAGRPVGLRQVHAAAHDRRAGGDHRRRPLHRRRARSTTWSRPSATSPWCSRTTRSTRT